MCVCVYILYHIIINQPDFSSAHMSTTASVAELVSIGSGTAGTGTTTGGTAGTAGATGVLSREMARAREN